jgi:hypothetical protein
LYNRFRDRLHIKKRFFAKLGCTTIIVLLQIMFDKDFSFSKTKTPQDQTDLSNIESHTTLRPSFNLHTIQKSTPMRPTPAPRMFAPTPNRQTTAEIEIELQQTGDHVSADYVTATQSSV